MSSSSTMPEPYPPGVKYLIWLVMLAASWSFVGLAVHTIRKILL